MATTDEGFRCVLHQSKLVGMPKWGVHSFCLTRGGYHIALPRLWLGKYTGGRTKLHQGMPALS